jgi:RNA polymerase sigma factor (sigma-70 family)
MRFETTLWTRIEALGEGQAALATPFVTRYRPAILAYLGRRGVSVADAEDVAQEVFVRLFTRDLLSRADRERGRFRSYLLGITKCVLLQRAERANAQKRGGGRAQVSLDAIAEPVAPEDDAAFQRGWIEHLLERALAKLALENARQHEVLRLRLREELSLKEIGERTERTAAQVKTDHHRGKQRLARLIKEEVKAYSSSHEEYASELASFAEWLGA